MFVGFTVNAQESQNLSRFVGDSVMRHAQISYVVRELQSNKVIDSYSSQKSCVPASVTKLITTATALEILGADYRFKTTLQTDGVVDLNGTLQGNLYIVGTGDPTLGSSHFNDEDFIKEWISELKKYGISSINGQVISDVSLYEQDAVSPLWLREDLGNYYGAGVFALSVFDNTVSLTIKSSAINTVPSIVSEFPNVGCVYNNQLKTILCKKDSIYILGEPYSKTRTLSGTVRQNQASISVKGDISNPPLFLAQYFVDQLKAANIDVKGSFSVSSEKADKIRKIIYTHYSPTLAEIIKITNFKSNNNYAEHLLKHLSLQKDSVANAESALKIVRNYWAEKGLDVSGLFMYDGSGLSPKNAICADFLCDLLVYMKTKSKNADVFYASLPIAGQTGTVSSFLKNSLLEGQVHLKSGSFKNVQSYAGYVSKNGKDYAFCLMVNNFLGERKNTVRLIEQLLANTFYSIN